MLFGRSCLLSKLRIKVDEAAIKFARKFQRKETAAADFISFTLSFHGRNMGALALTSKEYYGLTFNSTMSGVAFLYYGLVETVIKLIKSEKIVIIFVKPIQGEGGIYRARNEFLQFLLVMMLSIS